MSDIPMLKFDKSKTYLKNQMEIQTNNKQVISDIINNINQLIEFSDSDKANLEADLLTANNYLQIITQNIESIEELDSEISQITQELNDTLSIENRTSQTKEFFINSFSNIKQNITEYTTKFQKIETKLDSDNKNCSKFIDLYNLQNADNQVNNNSTQENSNESDNTTDTNNENIDRFTTEFKYILTNLYNTESENDATSMISSYLQNLMTLTTTPSTTEDATATNEESDLPEKNSDSNTNITVKNSEEISDTTIESENTTSTGNESPVVASTSTFVAEDYTNYSSVEKSILSEYTSFDPVFPTQSNNTENVETTTQEEETNISDSDNNEESLIDEITEEDLLSSDVDLLADALSNSDNITITIEDEYETESIVKPASKDNKALLSKDKIEKILRAEADNETLIVSEKNNKIYLPYKTSELLNYLNSYPDTYKDLSDVVKQEFILDLDMFMKHPSKTRFQETYNLIRNRDGKSVASAILYGLKLTNKSNLSPAIIAACKNSTDLQNYLQCLNSNNLKDFKAFNIIYEINPLKQK